MRNNPLISVLMPVYNAEAFIRESIKSVLNQTYPYWELVILNDGSTDQSIEIAKQFDDHRIVFYENEKNSGLTYSRNKLVGLARGEYLAWLDADDIAVPNRLELQVSFLEKNKTIGLLGGGVQPIDQNGNMAGKEWRYKTKTEAIPAILFFGNYFAQSAIMVRKSALEDFLYREEYPPAEDYDLWVRLLERSSGDNLHEVLVKYRVHLENVTHRAPDKMSKGIQLIRRNQFRELIPDNQELEKLFVEGCEALDFSTKLRLLRELNESNKKLKKYKPALFGAVLLKQLLIDIKAGFTPTKLMALINSGFLYYSITMLRYRI